MTKGGGQQHNIRCIDLTLEHSSLGMTLAIVARRFDSMKIRN